MMNGNRMYRVTYLLLSWSLVVSSASMQTIYKGNHRYDQNNHQRVGVPVGCGRDVSPEVPQSVHELRTGDISVVAAIGGAFTSGFQAKSRTVLDFTDYRGVSWSMGGDDGVSSLVNLLRGSGSPAIGMSIESNPTGFPIGQNGGFNMARTRKGSSESMHLQSGALVIDMKSNRQVDFEKDWKVITMLIGTYDLCHICEDNQPILPGVERVLDFLLENVPRAYVNLVAPMDVTKYAAGFPGLCESWQQAECPCGIGSSERDRERVREEARSVQSELKSLTSMPKYHAKDTFTVEYQPQFVDMEIPRTIDGQVNTTYFGPDCFYFSEAGHSVAGLALWNNMLRDPSERVSDYIKDQELVCPSAEKPFLCTSTNHCKRNATVY